MVILDRTPAAAQGAACSPLPKSPRFSWEVASPPSDPILPYLRSISRAMDELGTGPQYDTTALDRLKHYLTECIAKYGDDYQYSTDPRLLKIWILYCKSSNIQKNEPSVIDPWSPSTRNTLLEKINGGLRKFSGYYKSNKVYCGKVPLTSSLNVLRNKGIKLGGRKYQIKGSTGTGAFAKVYKATVDSNAEEMVALKIQNPSFTLEFYMYCQLDLRISDVERPSFGYAHEMHIFSDVSVLVCDYLPYGTLLDVINSHLVVGRYMDEVLCMYYTIEMLNMLETLHSVGIIHGDFKPDNILVCYPSGEITEDNFRSEKRVERNQGLCLVDWGRGIDLALFPSCTEFHGDCGTSGFRCIEMQEHRNWTYQVDTYGLCVVVHMMLHGSGMNVKKVPRIGGGYEWQPKQPFKRYWNVDLWQKLFSTLLNPPSNDSDVAALQSLRASFRQYMCSNRQLVGKLNQLLAKQKASLCSS
ncbi:uncharacterized protein LOC100194273 [Zea mays]|uniref:Mitotic checkpoint serine/threonine-protein kinase BUB1 n=1 Tax=Zea mays TaxID=4577 RepID=B4FI36_MAIZE|nr:uncharacterized protein LOC100194273 [Zea mays]ACF81779.1 unknown [Zea mays]|eukprot:NP_001132784.1 uncharacterized protein LOC100194273 [Zea mays]